MKDSLISAIEAFLKVESEPAEVEEESVVDIPQPDATPAKEETEEVCGDDTAVAEIPPPQGKVEVIQRAWRRSKQRKHEAAQKARDVAREAAAKRIQHEVRELAKRRQAKLKKVRNSCCVCGIEWSLR